MTIIDTFDDKSEAIISPQQMVKKVKGFPKVAVVAFGEKFITALCENYEAKRYDFLEACITIPIYKVNYKGKDIAVYCSTLGGPAAGGLLEEMIAKGCEKFVFFGSCGVLAHNIAANALIVPTAAYRDEGTSYHYVAPNDYIGIPTADKLAAIFEEHNIPYAKGKTWTTDALYRETVNNMEKRKQEGCIAVEMECASIMAVAQLRNVSVYQFLFAADSLAETVWDCRTLGNLENNTREKYLKIALEVAARI